MRALICFITIIALSGCASVGKTKAPVCDGKHRRPANLYGSVLDSAAPPQSASRTATPEKLSALLIHGSCRG